MLICWGDTTGNTYEGGLDGARVRTAPWRHVTREKVEDALSQFHCEIQQTPPMYVHSRPSSH
jgi:tRNA U55 pseudouridine synthase TruB